MAKHYQIRKGETSPASLWLVETNTIAGRIYDRETLIINGSYALCERMKREKETETMLQDQSPVPVSVVDSLTIIDNIPETMTTLVKAAKAFLGEYMVSIASDPAFADRAQRIEPLKQARIDLYKAIIAAETGVSMDHGR